MHATAHAPAAWAPSHPERLTFADRFALRGQPAGARADPPTLALAIEPNQMIGGAIARVTRGRGGRRRAEDRHRAADRARGAGGERPDSLSMNVAVQDRLGA